jgi:acyl-coenzyme A synthetase/AMP-(fatty) acid ligase
VETLPLLSHDSPTAALAYREGSVIDAQQFLADAVRLAESLPRGRHVLNVCLDRYHFAVGLAACLISDRISLLPSAHAPQVVRQLVQFAPDAFCLTDDARCDIDLPRFLYAGSNERMRRFARAWRVPQIRASQVAAIVFTSGSTGTPLPYRKTWGRLRRCLLGGAERLGLPAGRAPTLIGTVPPQHMYGFETTVLLALFGGCAFTAERPFYPADICAAIGAAPRPRALVSTPIHLRTLLGAGIELPPLDLILSATAPLEKELACEAERRFGARLVEIYGSTETGQIATRHTADSLTWRLLPEVRLSAEGGAAYAHGGHVEQFTALCDVVELTGVDEFILHGRTADLVNVAGKRSSFAYLNAQLNGIPGVLDGVFFLREPCSGSLTGAQRLAAAVVAPGVDAKILLDHLRDRIDPVFLPRPLLMVDRLPRNATGKLPQHALRSLADQHMQSRDVRDGARRRARRHVRYERRRT